MQFGISFSDDDGGSAEPVEFDTLEAAIESARVALLEMAKTRPAEEAELSVLISDETMPRARVALALSIVRLGATSQTTTGINK